MITILDLETTSRFPYEAWPTEIALVKLDFELNELERFETLIKPASGAKIDPSALRISNLEKSDLDKAHYFDRYWSSIAPLISESVLVAHNSSFDMPILQKCLLAMEIEDLPESACTLQLSRKTLGNKVKDFKLGTLCQYFGIPLQGHRALEDALATAELLRNLVDLNSNILDHLRARQSKSAPFSVSDSQISLSELPIKRIIKEVTQESSSIEPHILSAIRNSNKTQVVLTGTPSYGKEEFGRKAQKIGLKYQETSPGGKTIFVVKAQDFGQRKINLAIEKGIPVLTQSQFDILVEHGI